MLVRFLHISDAHIRPEATSAHDLELLHKALLATLKVEASEGRELDLVLFSGDLAFDGTRYDVCREFLEKILGASGITSKYGVNARLHFFIVPGNHDVDRKKTRYLQRTIESRKRALEFFSPSQTADREPHFRRMEAFCSFYNDFYAGARELSVDKPCYVESVRFEGPDRDEVVFRVAGLNTTWFSQGGDDHNRLWVGEPFWRDAISKLDADPIPTFTAVMQHHPCDWLHPHEGHVLEAEISRHADMFLFGHVHVPLYQSATSQYGECIRLQAGALHDPNLPQQRALVGTLDTRKRTLHLRPIAFFGGAQNVWTTDPTVYADEADHTRTISLPSRDREVSEKSVSEDPGVNVLAAFKSKLAKSVSALRVDHFIELHLSISSFVSMRTLTKNGEPSNDLMDVDRLLDVYDDRPIALLGDPGAGKTTVLADLARQLLNGGTTTVFFVPVALLNDATSLEQLLGLGVLDGNAITRTLKTRDCVILWDGVNESPRADLDSVFSELLAFTKEHSSARHIMTCRASQFPAWVREHVYEAQILPLTDTQIQGQFEYVLGSEAGRDATKAIRSDPLVDGLWYLCRNPLLLTMTLSLLRPPDPMEVADLSSKPELYASFLRQLSHREEAKRAPGPDERRLPRGLRATLLELLALNMVRSDLVVVDSGVGEAWIAKAMAKEGELDSWFSTEWRPTADELYAEVTTAPPMRAIEGRRLEGFQSAFLHQSFGEFLAAKRFVAELIGGRATLAELKSFALDESRRGWDFVGFVASMAPDIGALLSYITDLHKERDDQRLLVLAGICVRECPVVMPSVADDVRLRMIDAFKYGGQPFDYELIHSLADTFARHVSNLPPRLAEDVKRFRSKYSYRRPVEVREASIEALKVMIGGSDVDLASDAAYSLALRDYPDSAVKDATLEFILESLSHTHETVREQLVVALKEFGEPQAIQHLLGVIRNPTESPRIRAYALNALGRIGESEAVEPIIEFLLNHDNLYRDSASWSLQALAKRLGPADRVLLARIKQVYAQALFSETDDVEGRYCKGNLVYSLGELNATEYADQIAEWLPTVDDPYVREDGVHALGKLGTASSVAVLTPFVKDEDPIVRLKAAESLGLLADDSCIRYLMPLLKDPYRIVRESATEIVNRLSSNCAS